MMLTDPAMTRRFGSFSSLSLDAAGLVGAAMVVMAGLALQRRRREQAGRG
jgi:hypothetical protein